MSDTPFIKFFPSDFLGGTGGLSPAERGVYITLLCLIWDGDGPITMDEGRLARRCGMPKAPFKRALDALIDEGKIIRTNEGLSNDRAKKTLIDRQNRTQNASHAARSRWSEETEKIPKKQGEIDAVAMPEHCAADAKPEARSQIYGGGGDAGAREADFDDVGITDIQTDQPPPSQPEAPPGWTRLDREGLLQKMGADPVSGLTGPNGRIIGGMADMRIAGAWVDDLGITPDEVAQVVAEVMAKKTDGPPSSFKYFDQAMQRFAGQKAAPRLTPIEGGQNERNHQGSVTGRAGAAERAHQKLIAGFARAISDE